MTKTFPFLSFAILLLISCSEKNEEHAIELTSEEPILGFWKGKEIHLLNSSGNADWDFYITHDSIFDLNYPTEFYYGSKVNYTKDSLNWTNDGLTSMFRWRVQDSLLTLVGKFDSSWQDRIDSIIFVKREIQMEVFNDLQSNGYNSKLLTKYIWTLDSTAYISENPNWNKYLPKEILNFDDQPAFKIERHKIVYENDTFNIRSFSNLDFVSDDYHVLVLNHVVDKDTLKLKYYSD